MQDPTEIVVAGDGHVWIADEGATLPTGVTTDLSTDPDYTELGFTTEDGATFTLSRQNTDLNVWQSLDPVRIIATSRTATVAAVLRQLTPENAEAAFGGGTVTKGASSGSYEFPDPDENPVKVLVVDAIDNGKTVRFVFERTQQEGDVTTQLQRGDSANLPLTMRVLAGSQKPIIYSDLPQFTTAS